MIIDRIAGERITAHRPWPRVVVSADGWRQAGEELNAGRWTMLGLWIPPFLAEWYRQAARLIG